jgi:dethiobiotin synthetase
MTIWCITGTGTYVGKTHFAEALLVHLMARGNTVVGWKPIETGVQFEARAAPRTNANAAAHVAKVETEAPHTHESMGPDERALRKRSTHQPPPTLRFEQATSPSVAAAAAGTLINIGALYTSLRSLESGHENVVELPGGLFSHLTDPDSNVAATVAAATNADWIRNAPATMTTLLVAPNRLGVLHDVGACLRAAAHENLGISGLVLMGQADPSADASIATNLKSLQRAPYSCKLPICLLPFADVATLAHHANLKVFVDRIVPRSSETDLAQ